MSSGFTRRSALQGALAMCASSAAAGAIENSLRPVARPSDGRGLRPVLRPGLEDIVGRSNLGGIVGFVVQDLSSGQIVADVGGDQALPPASVTKAVTALYALETLGPRYRFSTHLFAKGVISDGVLDGDLILAGSGDPRLQTDDLIVLRTALKNAGITKITGRFQVWGGLIDKITEIEPSQLDHVGYNPAVSGLNLNFNRVHFEWERRGTGYRVQVDARGSTETPLVDTARVRLVDRNGPVYGYEDGDGVDRWTVARSALNEEGSRWLPVRYPALYTGDVLQALAAAQGIDLPDASLTQEPPRGTVIGTVHSPEMVTMMQRMLRFSTNITAEAAGLTSSRLRSGEGRGLRTSAFQMAQWVRGRSGAATVFDDHSGLSDGSQIKPIEMVRLLAADGVVETLYPILRNIPFLDERGNLNTQIKAEVKAKTGTLNFVSTLAGYLRTETGKDLAFAFFAADLDRRAAGKLLGGERPDGARTYNTRAKRLQQNLLRFVATRMVA